VVWGGSMDALEALITRRSVRQFSNTGIDHQLLEKALVAAQHAPIARNIQPWEYVVVQDHTCPN